jgi:hypothetical protein
MPNLKIKRVIGVYKPPKKLSDVEIMAKLKAEKEQNRRNYSLKAIRKHNRSFNKKIEERSKKKSTRSR